MFGEEFGQTADNPTVSQSVALQNTKRDQADLPGNQGGSNFFILGTILLFCIPKRPTDVDFS
jgi:hypothetical protein